jgi:hypothetical protein
VLLQEKREKTRKSRISQGVVLTSVDQSEGESEEHMKERDNQVNEIQHILIHRTLELSITTTRRTCQYCDCFESNRINFSSAFMIKSFRISCESKRLGKSTKTYHDDKQCSVMSSR